MSIQRREDFWRQVIDHGKKAIRYAESGELVDGSAWKTVLSFYEVSSTIDLDRHELLVEHRCHAIVLKRLVFHHVTPMAGGIADRQENRFVFGARLGERFVAPCEPVNRVAGVLQQVGTALARQPIHPQIISV